LVLAVEDIYNLVAGTASAPDVRAGTGEKVAEKRTILACSCEDTMPLDAEAIRRGCKGATVETARYLCRDQLDLFRKAAAEGAPLTVACTQEAPLFSEVAGEGAALSFVNIRETGGWSIEAASAGPKMAALIAAVAEPLPEVPVVSYDSEGVVLIYGHDESAIEAAHLLKDHLDVTVLICRPDHVPPPRVTEFPVVKGTIKSAKGHLGAFEIVVDDYAAPAPSSRDELSFAAPRQGAISRCDLILDLSGQPALFPASDLRDGYLRADPADPSGVLRTVLKARDLVGTFDKPRYITFTEDLCAHSRSKIVGCRRCLDLCPAGAIAPAGNHVAIDPHICAGCGQCAAACPTGAAAYALPPADALMRKLRTMLAAYREAGGETAVVLLHDEAHGTALIDMLARHGEGLPAHVLPLAVNEVTQVGLESIAAAFAYGASGVRLLLRAKPRHDIEGLRKTVALAEPILAGLGFTGERVVTIETDDPDALGAALRATVREPSVQRPATFSPIGAKRDVMRLALRELHRAAPSPVDVIPLPAGAAFGTVEVNVEGCTLCLSCVSACPTGALRDDPDRPTLRFAEDACVQCGLCKATCPEKVISLKPQLDFRAATASARLIKQEEPYGCIRCGKPFGVKSTVERVIAKLEGKHWMYKDSAKRLDVIRMCEDCRVAAMTETDFDPYGAPRPNPRTTEDYLRERERLKQEFEGNEGS
jgi:ferredoxin